MTDREVGWQAQKGPQTRFLQATEKEVLFAGGRGSGKSDAFLVDPLRYCENKNFAGLIIRQTMPQLQDLIDRAYVIYREFFPGTIWREKQKRFIFPSGATIEFGYCESVRDLGRYHGRQFPWIGIDELTLYDSEEILTKLQGSNRSKDPTLPSLIRATTNPGGPGAGWVRDRWVNLGPPDTRLEIVTKTTDGEFMVTRKYLESTINDNPILKDGDPEYYAWLQSIPDPILRRQWLECDWTAFEGKAFTDFKENIHVIEPFNIPRSWTRIRACDWGYASMAACIWMAIDYDDNLYVYREHITTRVEADIFARQVLEREFGENIKYGVLDGSTWAQRGQIGDTPADTMIKEGCRWIPSDRTKGSRVNGKMLIHTALRLNEITGQPKLKVFNTCKELIKELNQLPLDKNNTEDVDTDTVDHAYDALRYAILSRPRMTRSSAFDQAPSAPIVGDSTFGY